MTLEELRKRLREIVARMTALDETMSADGYEDKDEDWAEFDALEKEADGIQAKIKRLESVNALNAQIAADDAEVVPAAARGQGTIPGAQPDTEFETFGQFMHAVRFNQNDQRLASAYHEFDTHTEHRMDDGPSGGFMVPVQFRNTLMRVTPQSALVRPRATVIPAGSPPDSAVTMPALDQTGTAPDNVYGGVRVQKVSEGGEKPETEAKLREIKLEPREVAGTMVVTDKLLRNWQAAGPTLEGLFRQAVTSYEDHQFLSGNGVGGPLGAINSSAAYAVTRQAVNAFDYDDLSAILARFLMRGGSPVWSISKSVYPELLTMRNETGDGGDGALIWQPNARDAAGNQMLMGYPIRWNERAPALGTKGDVGLFDFSQYLVKDGSGPFVAASEHVHFTSNKTVIKIFWNVDGQPWLTEPFRGEDNFAQSPFVVLN